ncbi:MAG: TlyA family RNA methyltransferase [Firmicutes bacterium]|nr:TlyA family RNA methyltransferase [Bacillota bacterium]
MGKERLDKIIVDLKLAPTREKAQALIISGAVSVNGKIHLKAGTKFDPSEISVELINQPLPYVSRGGLKLEKALAVFQIDVTGKKCLDIGASTGGFTDCLLQHGAAAVIALDVGYGQLAWSLRQDPRVIVMEKTNVRYITLADLAFQPDLITVDTSFISVTKFLPVLESLLPEEGELICLIKPQFEAGPAQVGKGGIVRDPRVWQAVLTEILQFAAGLNLGCLGLTISPIKGTKGNIEFLAYFRKGVPALIKPDAMEIAELVSQAAEQL